MIFKKVILRRRVSEYLVPEITRYKGTIGVFWESDIHDKYETNTRTSKYDTTSKQACNIQENSRYAK